MMLITPKNNSTSLSTYSRSLTAKPLNLKELLQLRDGLVLQKKPVPGFITKEIGSKSQLNGFTILGLN